MFVESRTVSHTAGDFATRYLFSDDFMTRAKQANVPKGVVSLSNSGVLVLNCVSKATRSPQRPRSSWWS